MPKGEFSNCARLHDLLSRLPLCTLDTKIRSGAGVYFFYESGETCTGHGSEGRRIVRVGTSGNAASRTRNHYITSGTATVFRRHICRALARQLDRWESWMGNPGDDSRDSKYPLDIQEKATEHLKNTCSFRWIPISDKGERLDLETRSIGSAAACNECGPSSKWLGQHSYDEKIRKSGLWNIQHTHGRLRLRAEDLENVARSCDLR